MTRQERSRLRAYLSFAAGIAIFALLFVPALFIGSAQGVIGAIALMLVTLLLTLWFGEHGFDTSKSSTTRPAEAARRPRLPLDPEHTEFDDENWLRVHGGPGTSDDHRGETPRRT